MLRMQGFFNEVALDLVKKDGERFPVLVNATERTNAEGKPQFIRLTVFNSTDRHAGATRIENHSWYAVVRDHRS